MSTEKIHHLASLCELTEQLRADGKTIVTTNGCFDILHVGHIRYLQQARALGDVLIVAINSDRSVKENKGPKRPMNGERDRAEALAALACVDYVVIFDEKGSEPTLERLKPHIHTKGGDYVIEQIPERYVVESGGGRVVLLPATDGFSTTRLIERIVDAYKD